MKFANNVETSEGLQQKSFTIASNEQLNEALYAWFIQQEYLVLQSPLLQKKAKHSCRQLHAQLATYAGGAAESFKASTGWLEKDGIA